MPVTHDVSSAQTSGRPARRRLARRTIAAATAVIAAGAVLTACSSGSSGPPTISFYDQPSSDTAQQAAIDRCNKLADGAYKIVFDKLPSAADQQRQQLVRRLAAHDTSIDLMGMDVTWPAEFWSAGWLREWTGARAAAVKKADLPGPLATATYHGHLTSAPFNSNTQLLWYRKDLVKTPPTTWAQMISMAQKLHSEGKPSYVEEQGAQYEGLTVWFNSLVASANGSILNKDSSATTLGKPAVQAATIMKQIATTTGVADPSLSVNMEDQGRLALEARQRGVRDQLPLRLAVDADRQPEGEELQRQVAEAELRPGRPSRAWHRARRASRRSAASTSASARTRRTPISTSRPRSA